MAKSPHLKVEDHSVSVFDRLREGLRRTAQQFVGRLEDAAGGAQTASRTPSGSTGVSIETTEALEEALIQADVGVAATDRIVAAVRERSRRGEDLKPIVKSELLSILEHAASAPLDVPRPRVVMVVGVNGTGKTTTVGKLAHLLTKDRLTPMICAADTFRAAAVEQLEEWARRAHVDLIKTQSGADPAAVVFDAIQAGSARGVDVVIVDTAGRLHTRVNLMAELQKIRRVAGKAVPGAPHDVLLVLDATVGQNGLVQAREFLAAAGVNGVVLTKLDGTAKGGIAVAIAAELNVPIRYVGVGEGLDDLIPFQPRDYVDALFEDKW